MNMPEELVLENEAFISSEFWKERKWWVRQKSKQVMNEKKKFNFSKTHKPTHSRNGKERGDKPKETNTKL